MQLRYSPLATPGEYRRIPMKANGRALAILASLTVFLGACGGSRSGPEVQAATQEGLAATARAAADTVVERPASMYDYLSARCQEETSRSEFAGEIAFGAAFFEGLYGFGIDEVSVTEVEVVEFSGQAGTVRVVMHGPSGEAIDQDPESWTYEDDRWVIDDCGDLGGGSGTMEDVSTETALGWPQRFCQLSEGMTREEVRAIMGEPTSEFLDENSQDGYHAYQFRITVFYHAPRAQDPDPMHVTVRQLDADSTGQFTEMTMEDTELFPCADEVFDELTLQAVRANSGS